MNEHIFDGTAETWTSDSRPTFNESFYLARISSLEAENVALRAVVDAAIAETDAEDAYEDNPWAPSAHLPMSKARTIRRAAVAAFRATEPDQGADHG